MKIEQENKLNKSEIVSPVEQKSEVKVVGSIRKISGLHLWKMNLSSKEISIIEPEKTDVNFTDAQKGVITTTSKVRHEEGYIYTQALNRKNAIKKFAKMIE